jgi:putative addiction module CopG family antidote
MAPRRILRNGRPPEPLCHTGPWQKWLFLGIEARNREAIDKYECFLTDELANFVTAKGSAGLYSSSSEVVHEAPRLMEKLEQHDAEKLRLPRKACEARGRSYRPLGGVPARSIRRVDLEGPTPAFERAGQKVEPILAPEDLCVQHITR